MGKKMFAKPVKKTGETVTKPRMSEEDKQKYVLLGLTIIAGLMFLTGAMMFVITSSKISFIIMGLAPLTGILTFFVGSSNKPVKVVDKAPTNNDD